MALKNKVMRCLTRHGWTLRGLRPSTQRLVWHQIRQRLLLPSQADLPAPKSDVLHGAWRLSMFVVLVGSAREGGDVVDLCVLAPRGFVHNRQVEHAAQIIHM